MINDKSHSCDRVNELIPVLSYFTGGGFLDIGFTRAGFKVMWANENNDTFANMYEFAISSLVHQSNTAGILKQVTDRRSIQDIEPHEIMKIAFPGGRPRLFGIIGGPPCPDFSDGGKHRGHEGDHGRLSNTFVDHICLIKPHFFVFENVHGLLKTGKHRAFLEMLEIQLERAKYCVDLKVLNSLDFGLAQDRQRLFLVGVNQSVVRKCLGKKVVKSERSWFPWPVEGRYTDAKRRFEWPTINQTGDKPQKPEEIPSELTVFGLLSNIPEDLPNAKEGFRPRSDKFSTVREGDISGKSFKRLHRYRYSPTACYGNNEVHLHPWENRRLTIREAMRIQGIPDDYSLPAEAPLTAKFKMIANGVPVPLAEQVAISMREFLRSFPLKGR
jgi:DNA (cytosine-5)-methyltransferase 1